VSLKTKINQAALSDVLAPRKLVDYDKKSHQKMNNLASYEQKVKCKLQQ